MNVSKKHAIDKEWLDKQTQLCEMHYQSEPPTRTDNGEQTVAELKQVHSAEPEKFTGTRRNEGNPC